MTAQEKCLVALGKMSQTPEVVAEISRLQKKIDRRHRRVLSTEISGSPGVAGREVKINGKPVVKAPCVEPLLGDDPGDIEPEVEPMYPLSAFVKFMRSFFEKPSGKDLSAAEVRARYDAAYQKMFSGVYETNQRIRSKELGISQSRLSRATKRLKKTESASARV